MKITTFNPLIITKDPEPTIKLFEELGFERRHTKEGIGDDSVTDVRMKHPNGFYVDVSSGDGEYNMIRMNVMISMKPSSSCCPRASGSRTTKLQVRLLIRVLPSSL